MNTVSRADIDLFCRVIDNWGDAGVCWRLARALAQRGKRVRLWMDDLSPLRWMRQGEDAELSMEIRPWHEAEHPHESIRAASLIIEAFGCHLPEPFQRLIALEHGSRPAPHPFWLNLEYLSAEAWTLRCHGLPSPILTGEAQGLSKHFFYPGFDPRSGGLLWDRPFVPRPEASQELSVFVFCYEQPLLGLARSQTEHWARVLGKTVSWHLAHGAPQTQWPADGPARRLALGSQQQFDQWLEGVDWAWVRGEDSFVAVQMAGRPFLWQAYPQSDGASLEKVHAFLDLYLEPLHDAPELKEWIRQWHVLWNRLNEHPSESIPNLPGPLSGSMWSRWQRHAAEWALHLRAGPHLADQILRFTGDPIYN